MANERNEQGLDQLLDDIRQLLEDDAPLAQGDERFYEELGPSEPKPHSWTETQKLPRHVAKLQRNQDQAYADWLYEQGRSGGAHTPPPMEEDFVEEKPKKKKRHILRKLVLTLLALTLLLAAAVVFLLPQQPMAVQDTLGSRRDDAVTILLAGTDESGARTDTLILLTLDGESDTASLVSIPRDTLVNGGYTVPKINSVYGANNGGQVGVDMLMTRVSQCIGFRPDGYVLLELGVFENFVDALGGVTFEVPMDMYYSDPSQDLVIDLKAGTQTLNGKQAMGLVRFRSGYADADLGRVQVQRQFLSALMEQTVSVKGVAKAPMLLEALMQADTDLSVRNLLWLARTALQLDLSKIETATLPGSAVWTDSGSYYILDPASVAQTVNAYCNPYEYDVTTADLEIRTE